MTCLKAGTPIEQVARSSESFDRKRRARSLVAPISARTVLRSRAANLFPLRRASREGNGVESLQCTGCTKEPVACEERTYFMSFMPRVSVAAASMLLLYGCTALPHDPKEKFILVATNTKLPYWTAAQSGLMHAVNEMKVKGEMVGPDTYDIKAEHDEFRHAVAQKPTGILRLSQRCELAA